MLLLQLLLMLLLLEVHLLLLLFVFLLTHHHFLAVHTVHAIHANCQAAFLSRASIRVSLHVLIYKQGAVNTALSLE